MRVLVSKVSVPAMSTVGIGRGIGPDGEEVAFGGDHRMMAAIGEAISETGEPVEAEVYPYQLVDSFDAAIKGIKHDVRRYW